jgi:uncharacterized protein YqfB (UPF0267 family)
MYIKAWHKINPPIPQINLLQAGTAQDLPPVLGKFKIRCQRDLAASSAERLPPLELSRSFMLLFKKKFLPAIRAGVKTQTIRLWNVLRYRAGQRSYIPGAGYIRIETIDRVTLDELTETDAQLDGFDSLAALHAELQTMYADELAAGQQAYRVSFHLLPQESQPDA